MQTFEDCPDITTHRERAAAFALARFGEREAIGRRQAVSPVHTPGTPWTKADVVALLAEHGSAAAAAKAVGVSRQRMHQLMLAHGIAPLPLPPLRDPSVRERGAVSITLTREQRKRLNARARTRSRSAVVRDALDALIASDLPPHDARCRGSVAVTVALTAEHHAWLNAHGRGMRSALVQQALDLLMPARSKQPKEVA